MADRITDRRTPLIFGLLILAGATALLAVGTSLTLLIVGRVLQGLSGAIVWISGMALLVDTVGQAGVGQAMGFASISLSLGFLLAPTLGGIVAEQGGYEDVFAMCWASIAVDIALRLVLVEKKVAVKWLGLEGAYGTRAVSESSRDAAAVTANNTGLAEATSGTHEPNKPSVDPPQTALTESSAQGRPTSLETEKSVAELTGPANTELPPQVVSKTDIADGLTLAHTPPPVTNVSAPPSTSDANSSAMHPPPAALTRASFQESSEPRNIQRSTMEQARAPSKEVALPSHSNGIELPPTLPVANPAETLHLPIMSNNLECDPGTKARIPLLTLLASPRLLASLYATLIQASLITSLDSTVPIHVRAVFHWNSLGAGLIFLPITMASLFSPLVGWWIDRRGPRLAATLAFLTAAPFFVLLRLIVNDRFGIKAGFSVMLFAIGFNLALALPPVMAETSAVVVEIEQARPGIFGEKGAMAQAYALFNLAFAGGCLVGPVWGGMINERAGWGTMSWTLGLLSFTTAFPVFALVGGPVWRKKKDDSHHCGSQQPMSG